MVFKDNEPKYISVKVTKEEYEAIEKIARKEGLKLRAYIKSILLKDTHLEHDFYANFAKTLLTDEGIKVLKKIL